MTYDPADFEIADEAEFWHCNSCGEEADPADECCDDGEIVPDDV